MSLFSPTLTYLKRTVCRSKAHRESRDSRKEDKELQEKREQNPGVRCSHCGRDDFGQDGFALRSHIESEHSSGMSVCGVCGQRFALPQDLGAHVRGGCCEGGRASRKMKEEGNVSRKMEVSVKVEIQEFVCTEEGCGFEADSFNMLLFHQGWCSSFTAIFNQIQVVNLWKNQEGDKRPF